MNWLQVDSIRHMQLLGEHSLSPRFSLSLSPPELILLLLLCSAYDRAAIKFRGVEADINFSIEDYEDDLKQVLNFGFPS